MPERIVIEMQLERVTPESVGIHSPAIVNLLDKLEKLGVEMHSLMLLRHGRVCAEGWWRPYAPETPHIMFSFSKSLTSTAIGFAEQEGILSLEERLVDIFPDKLPERPSENLQKATVWSLLTMSCGHETEIPNLGLGNPDWIAAFLSHPFVFKPGSKFHYNTAGTNMLCAVLKRKTGQNVSEFLRTRLFQPLGMSDIQCQKLPDGIDCGGAGFFLTTEDMARFMQFVSQKGVWDGKQLLNEGWFDRATSRQADTDNETGNWKLDWGQGYGFQFWRCIPEGIYRGDGAFGQFGVVFSKQDAVLIITSASLRTQELLTAVWETLLPGMAAGTLPENRMENHILNHRLKSLMLSPMLGVRNPDGEKNLSGAVYVPDAPLPRFTDVIGGTGKSVPDGGSLLALAFRFEGDDASLVCTQDNGELCLRLGLCGSYETTMADGVPYHAIGRWRAQNKLEFEFRNTTTASGKRMIFTFTGSRMTVSADCTLPVAGGLADEVLPELSFTLRDAEGVSLATRQYWEN